MVRFVQFFLAVALMLFASTVSSAAICERRLSHQPLFASCNIAGRDIASQFVTSKTIGSQKEGKRDAFRMPAAARRSVEHYAYSSYGERTIYDSNLNALPEYSSGIMGTQWGWQARPSLPGSFRRFMDFRNRLFMPAIGMWVTPDPADVHDGPSVCSWGGGQQDPINTTDPMGLALFATDEQSASKLANQLQAYADQGRQPGEQRVKIGYRKTGDRYRIVSDSRYAATNQAIRSAGGNALFRQFASALTDDQSKLTAERDGFGWSIAELLQTHQKLSQRSVRSQGERLVDEWHDSSGFGAVWQWNKLFAYAATDGFSFGAYGRNDEYAAMYKSGMISESELVISSTKSVGTGIATGVVVFGTGGLAGGAVGYLGSALIMGSGAMLAYETNISGMAWADSGAYGISYGEALPGVSSQLKGLAISGAIGAAAGAGGRALVSRFPILNKSIGDAARQIFAPKVGIQTGSPMGFGNVQQYQKAWGRIAARDACSGSGSYTRTQSTFQSFVVEGPLAQGRAFEAQQLAEIGQPINTAVWRPTQAQMDSAAFRVIVGKPKFASGGLPVGTRLDAAASGFTEIKWGSSTLNSSYQLRLQTYHSLIENQPYTIRTTRPVNPSFRLWLERWGGNIEPIGRGGN